MTKENINIILADDHLIVRDGIKVLLEEDNVNNIVYEASNGLEVLEFLKNELSDIIIMDLSMPVLNGIFTTERIKKKHPDIKIIILSRHDAEEYIVEAFRAGADGYIVKNAASHELRDAVKIVSIGNKYLSPSISNVVIRNLNASQNININQLTPRENEIYQLLAEGCSSKEIANKLYISVETVSTHRKNIMRKLNVRNIVELTKKAIQSGIVEFDTHKQNYN